jgi:tRNA(fMet)-specific endonuclease VapC
MRGWMAHLARSRVLARQIEAYRRLKEFLDRYLKVTVLEFDEAAAVEFKRLQSLRLRVGTMDLKIAAIALAHSATVLTRNVKDFVLVPGLRVEDWTR